MKKTALKLLSAALCFSLLLCSGCSYNAGSSSVSSDDTSSGTTAEIPRGEALSEQENLFEGYLYSGEGFYSFTELDAPVLEFNEAKSIYGEKSINIIGDSITHGMNSGRMFNNSWANLFKNSFNKYYGTNNYGYVLLFDDLAHTGNTEIHSVDIESGSWATARHIVNTPGYTTVSSGDAAGSTLLISIDRRVDGYDRHINGFYIYYVSGPSSGGFDVTVNGTKVHSVAAGGTTDYTARTEYIAVPEGLKNELDIRIIKTDSSTVTLAGIAYAESDGGVMINNYSLTGMTLTEIDNNLLKKLCQSNYVIFCLGYNDAGSGQDINTFRAKLQVVADACKEYGSTLIVADFLWPKGELTTWATSYRNELFNCAMRAEGYYIDFTGMYKIDPGFVLSDAAHPTPAGHKLIARKLCYFLGIPFTSDLD